LDENKKERLIEWVVDVFGKLLVKVVARRETLKCKKNKVPLMTSNTSKSNGKTWLDDDVIYLEEVKEVIDLPKFDARTVQANEASVRLSDIQKDELKDFIVSVAELYSENSFHCFEHAAHVTMSKSS
jgi:3-dehydroquinate dehydratase